MGDRRSRHRFQLGLRGMVVLLLVVAVGFALVRPITQDKLRHFERVFRIKLNERDLYRHLNDGRHAAEQFVQAVRSGQVDAARELTTTRFRRRMNLTEFVEFIGASSLDQEPCELVRGVLSFSDTEGCFVSSYSFQCGAERDRSTLVTLIFVTETGRLRVDRIEVEEPDSQVP